ALKNYKLQKGTYPKNLEVLVPKFIDEIPRSGFGIFDSKINYQLLQNGKTQLSYKVKFGFICESYNCIGGINFSTWAKC
ncbi:MAG: hypothetical protein AAF573_01000, partial [Bacteroidota bacterium]